MKEHDIYCLMCGKIFKGSGQTVFCSLKCITEYNNYWDYRECDER